MKIAGTLVLTIIVLAILTGWVRNPSPINVAVPRNDWASLADSVRHEIQANTFTSSSQAAATLANYSDGSFVVVWQSRRQQEGTSGIFLQRFSSTGKPIGQETEVNLFTHNMQTSPAVAVGSDGSTWVAWESFGQDGSFNAIMARRFERDSFIGGDEILVNQQQQGNQSDVVIATDKNGQATFYWVTQTADRERKQVVGRRFDSSGSAEGDEFVVSETDRHQGLPSVAVNKMGRCALVWAEQNEFGQPAGIHGRIMDLGGTGKTFAVDVPNSERHIEPSISMDAQGNFVVLWLISEGSEFEVYARGFEPDGNPVGPPIRISEPGSKYVSGAAVTSDAAEGFVAVWNQQTDEFGRDINLMARPLDSHASPQGTAMVVNRHTDGRHRMAAASGKSRIAFADGQLRTVWSGKNENDDSSANVTVLAPANSPFSFENPAIASGATRSESDSAAKPHEPPTFDRRLIASEPFGGFEPLGPPGTDFGFTAINQTGWNPPDPSIAVGPNQIAAMTNGAIAFFTKTGALTFFDQIENSFGFWGSLGATNLVFDPEIIFDPHSNRFIAMANERAPGGGSFFLLAVSDDDNPNGSWFRYRLNVNPLAGSNIDSPNLAVDDEFVYLTADFFDPNRYLVYILRKSELLVGAAPVTSNLLVTGSHSFGIPLIYDTDVPAFYMIEAFEFGNFNTVRFHAITNQLASPQRVTTNVTVPPYGHPQDPPQQGTSVRPELFEARFWSCVYRDGSLWAVHHHSPGSNGLVRARWYEFAMNGWPTSGQNPTLVQSGELTPTNNSGQPSATFFPSIWADESGNAAITTSRSSSSEFISMYRAVRAGSDPPGTFQPIQLVRESTSQYTTDGRWGDYSGTTSDPAASNTFWGINEFALSNGAWQTHIARYIVEELLTTILPGAPAVLNGSISSGTAASVFESDDEYLEFLAAPTSDTANDEIAFVFSGNAVDTDFSTLRMVVESAANTPNVVQTIEMFDFQSSEFVVVDSRTPTLQDSLFEIVLTENVDRFITPGAGTLLTRISIRSTGPVLQFPWSFRLDQFVWQTSD